MLPSWSDILGQEKICRFLQRAIEQEQLPHALLFTEKNGGEGLPLAFATAKALHLHALKQVPNQQERIAKTTLQLDQLAHPDLHCLFPIVKQDKMDSCDDYLPLFREKVCKTGRLRYGDWVEALQLRNTQLAIPVTEAAALEEKLQYKPHESDLITVIVWLPEKMHNSTANKLLKLIEEPPTGVFFLFVSQQKQELLPTIISRVQILHTTPIPQEALAKKLLAEHGISKESALRIAHLAEGNYARAERLLAEEEAVPELTALAYRALMLPLRGSNKEKKLYAEELHGHPREQLCALCIEMAKLLREAFVCHLERDTHSPLLYTLKKNKVELSSLSLYINEQNVETISREIDAARTELAQNVSAKMIFFDLFVKLSAWYQEN